MILYHSSNVSVERPDTNFSRNYLDFGKGFYLTSLYEQAVKYAQRFMRRQQNAWLNTYELNYNADDWRVRIFEAYDREWLDFVSRCRAGEDDSDYDIVIGGIANDKVIQTLDRYFEGELSENDTLGLLKYEKPNNQYCIRSQKMLDKCLNYLESSRL